ncbi:MAG: hypothetical protein J6Z01_02760 [Bacteroidales bacterium]|nr:hypothetical protein [Bacteroidales bacterium]
MSSLKTQPPQSKTLNVGAQESCQQVGHNVDDHFPDVRKVIEAGKTKLRPAKTAIVFAQN